MKKAYVTPAVEKVEFQYDKVVVASGGLLPFEKMGDGSSCRYNDQTTDCPEK